MKPGTHCPAIKKDTFLCLLNFARISKSQAISPYPQDDKKALITALDSLVDSSNPSLRSVLPLIHHNTKTFGLRDLLHPATQKLLKDSTMLLIGTEMLNRHWLKNAIAAFKRENIPIILLKGAAFAGSLYPEDAPRVGVDLDLLVSKNDFESACALMNRTMSPVLLSDDRVATHDTLFERVFTPRTGRGPTVEIHRALTNPSIFNIDEKKLWDASEKHQVYNSDLVRILSSEDTLLHLAVHAFRDLDFCSHNILDAHEIWCQWNPDPEKTLDRAEQWGARKVLYYLLYACKAIMETPVPDSLLDHLRPSWVLGRINTKIIQTVAEGDTDQGLSRYRCVQMISQLTFPDRLAGGITFQLFYGKTRFRDWIIARKNR